MGVYIIAVTPSDAGLCSVFLLISFLPIIYLSLISFYTLLVPCCKTVSDETSSTPPHAQSFWPSLLFHFRLSSTLVPLLGGSMQLSAQPQCKAPAHSFSFVLMSLKGAGKVKSFFGIDIEQQVLLGRAKTSCYT